jgi:hypothetical protein
VWCDKVPEQPGYRNITRTPQKLLNDTLEAAGVKLEDGAK